jgi:Cu-processing system permease protein
LRFSYCIVFFIETGFSLIIAGVLLTLVFVSFAMLAAILAKTEQKGIGIAIFIWIFSTSFMTEFY